MLEDDEGDLPCMVVSDSPMDIYARESFRFLTIITSTFPISSHWLYLPKTAQPPKDNLR